jgi:hypothetical protein
MHPLFSALLHPLTIRTFSQHSPPTPTLSGFSMFDNPGKLSLNYEATLHQ